MNLPLDETSATPALTPDPALTPHIELQGELFEERLLVTTSLCVVLPMYNEAERIDATLAALARSSLNRPDVRLLFVDDGSTDGSAETVLDVSKQYGFSRPVDVSIDRQNRGKGSAVRRGILEGTGRGAPLVAFLDADLSLDPSLLDQAVQLLTDSQSDVVAGNRIVDRSHQPKLRRAVSLVFRRLARAIAPTGVNDTQCACKLFTADAAERIFGPLATPGFAFDVEVLLRARSERLRVIEMDVAWRHTPGSRVNPVVESFVMTRDVIRVRRLLRRQD